MPGPEATGDAATARTTRADRASKTTGAHPGAARTARARTGAHSSAIVGQPATVEIHAPAGSAVEIDGERRGVAPFPSPLPVGEGSHLIRVTLGRGVYDTRLAARAGEEYTLDVTFVGDL